MHYWPSLTEITDRRRGYPAANLGIWSAKLGPMHATVGEMEPAIRQRLRRVEEEIIDAARGAGRSSDTVRLVVVTKGQPNPVVEAALRAGARILGENYVEEAIPKIEALGGMSGSQGVQWHMIGHIQGRKAKQVVPHFDLIHSVDSSKLAQRLDATAATLGRKIPALLEFNVGGERGKAGWDAADEADWPGLRDEIAALVALPNLATRGLMTMPPLAAVAEDSRPYFRRLAKLQAYFQEHVASADWHELSMGTSTDYIVAVQEGATLVRVGEAILGPRPSREAA